jgi:hypothetical protein
MSQLGYTLYALHDMGFSFYACKNWQQTGWISSLIVCLVAIALVYDDSYAAMVNLLRKGDSLRVLTIGQFLPALHCHAAFDLGQPGTRAMFRVRFERKSRCAIWNCWFDCDAGYIGHYL